MLLVLAAVVAQPKGPEQHPALAESLAVIDRDTTEAQQPELDAHERARLTSRSQSLATPR